MIMGLTKDRNGMDLTEAEDIKKRWQEYTEELYKKDALNDFYCFEFTKASFMAQDVIYPGEGSMCT